MNSPLKNWKCAYTKLYGSKIRIFVFCDSCKNTFCGFLGVLVVATANSKFNFELKLFNEVLNRYLVIPSLEPK